MTSPTEQQCRDYFEDVKAGNVDGAKVFVKAFPDFVDMRNTRKETMMMMAAAFGHAEMVGMLLDHGAVIDAANGIGTTAVMNAVLAGHKETLKLLLDRGAMPESVSKGLVLAAAKMQGFYGIEKMLEEATERYAARMLQKKVDGASNAPHKGLPQDMQPLPRIRIKPKDL